MCCLVIDGVRIITKIEATIRKHIHDPALLEYWHEKGSLLRTAHDKIDWPALTRARKSTQRHMTIGITKLFSHNCATGVKMVLWGFRDNDRCPLCGGEYEDVSHILTCQDVSATDQWSKSLRKFDIWMETEKTDPEIRRYLIRRLRAWHKGIVLPVATGILEPVIMEQDEIGWKNFLFGFVSSQWARIQQREYNRIGSRRTGRRWVTQLIKSYGLSSGTPVERSEQEAT